MGQFKVALVAHEGLTVPESVSVELARHGIDFVAHECRTREELAQHAGDADVVWVFGGSRILTAENLAAIPHCGAIIRTGSGTDNVPVTAATARGIVVANTPEAVSDAVAEHAIGLLFACLRQIALQERAVRGGSWRRSVGVPHAHLHGQMLGLVGFGHIGQLVARRMSGFDLAILAYDPYVSGAAMAGRGVRAAPLDDILARSDVVSLHCPLTEDTYHAIGERELRLMKPTAILINTSRGAVVDEPALARALAEGWIAAAGLDVLEQEPPSPDNPLLRLDNVVITPHIAGQSDEYLQASWQLSLDAVIALAHGHWPRSCVNRAVRPRWTLDPAEH